MAKSKLDAEVITDTASLERVVPEWSELAEARASSPFSLPTFALAYWHHQESGALRVVVVRDEGRLVGLLPVYERRFGPGGILRWLGHGQGTTGQMLLADPADERVAALTWDTLAEASSRRVALQLDAYRGDGPGLLALRRSEAWQPFLELRHVVPEIRLPTELDGDDVMAGRSRRSVRQMLSRVERKLEAGGRTWQVEEILTPADLDASLSEIDALVDRAEQQAAKSHVLAGSARAMTLEWLRNGLASGEAAVFVLRIDGDAAAVDAVALSAGTAFGFLRRRDAHFDEFSTGHLLVRHLLGWTRDSGRTTLDLGLGDDEYKRLWLTHTYDGVVITGGRRGARAPARMATATVDLAFTARAAVLDRARHSRRR